MRKNGKLRKFTALILAFTLAFGTAAYAYAGQTRSEVKKDLKDVKEQKEDVSNQMAQAEKDIKAMQVKVDGINAQIKQTSSEITQTEADIQKKEKEMQEREDNLNERLKVMYKSGSVGFLDILLGSSSISEFVSNIEVVHKIYENDVEVLDTLEKEHKELEQIKADLKVKKENLAVQKEEAAKEQKALDAKKKELEKKEDELKAEADRLTQKLKSMVSTTKTYGGGQFTWPCPSTQYITSTFGNRYHPVLKTWKYHTGLDIGGSSGSNIVAAADGTVILASVYGGYGNCVMIDHGSGIVTVYGHASSLLVSAGQNVTKGQVIARVGSTGISTGPHLHFEVRVNGEYVNPLSYL